MRKQAAKKPPTKGGSRRSVKKKPVRARDRAKTLATASKTIDTPAEPAKPKTPPKKQTKKPIVARKPALGQSAAMPEMGEPAAERAAAPQAPKQPGPTEILGQVAWLMMHSPAHKHLFTGDMEWLVLPPLLLQQFRIFRKKNIPIAYASWGYLTEEAEQRLLTGGRKLAPADWKAGDRLWLIDLIAPFGGADEIMKGLCEKVFPGQSIKSFLPTEDGKGLRVVELGDAGTTDEEETQEGDGD